MNTKLLDYLKKNKVIYYDNLIMILGYNDETKLLTDLYSVLEYSIKEIGEKSKYKDYTYINNIEFLIKKIYYNRRIKNNDLKPKENELINKMNKVCRVRDKKISTSFLKIKEYLVNIHTSDDLVHYLIFEQKYYPAIDKVLNKTDVLDKTIYRNIENITEELLNNYETGIKSNNVLLTQFCYLTLFKLASKLSYGLNYMYSEITSKLKQLELSLTSLIDNSDKKEYLKQINHLLLLITSKAKDLSLEKKYSINIVSDKSIYDEFKLVKDNQYKEVLDLRNITNIGIDTNETEYYDDTISLCKLKNGNLLLCAFITDINKYVVPDSLLDKRTYNIGSNFYWGDNSITMLPNELTPLLSLNKNGDKSVYAILLEYTNNFELVDFKIKNALIKVSENLCPSDVDSIIKNEPDNKYYEMLTSLLELTQKINNNSNDKVNDKCGDTIVKEVKILINSMLAEKMYANGYPFIYRNSKFIESKPVPNLLKIMSNSKKLSKLISFIKLQNEESFYSATNIGHEGLELKAYSHSTTPLRSYSSIFNQRLIQKFIIDKDFSDKELYMYEEKAKDVSNNLNKVMVLNQKYVEELVNNC